MDREFNNATSNYEKVTFVWVGSELRYRPSLETVDAFIAGLRPALLASLHKFVLLGDCPWLRLLLTWLQDHMNPEAIQTFRQRFETVQSLPELQARWPGLVMREVPRIHKRLFGEPLERVNDGELPEAISSLINWIAERGTAVPGIFRLSADGTALDWLRSSLNAGRVLDGDRLDPHEAACLLKLYFRALPTPIIPQNLHHLLVLPEDDPQAAVQLIRQRLLPHLSQQARALLGKLMWMLSCVAAQEKVNRMSARNLGICWAPNLMYDEQAKDQFALLKASLAVTELMISHYEDIFARS